LLRCPWELRLAPGGGILQPQTHSFLVIESQQQQRAAYPIFFFPSSFPAVVDPLAGGEQQPLPVMDPSLPSSVRHPLRRIRLRPFVPSLSVSSSSAAVAGGSALPGRPSRGRGSPSARPSARHGRCRGPSSAPVARPPSAPSVPSLLVRSPRRPSVRAPVRSRPRAVCAPSAAAVAALLHLHFRGSTSASSPLADPPVAAAPLLRNVRPPACELRPAVNPSIRLLPPVCSSRWSSWLVLQHRSWRLCMEEQLLAVDLLQP